MIRKRILAIVTGTLVLMSTMVPTFTSYAEVIDETCGNGDVSVAATECISDSGKDEAANQVENAEGESVSAEGESVSAEGEAVSAEGESISAGEESADSQSEAGNETSDPTGDNLTGDNTEEEGSTEETQQVVQITDEKETEDNAVVAEPLTAPEFELDVPFADLQKVNGVSVSVHAAAGVLPAGAKVVIREVSGRTSLKTMKRAVESEISEGETIRDIRIFDITIFDRFMNEVQPDTSRGRVQVLFENIDTSQALSDDTTSIKVFHLTEGGQTAEQVRSYLAEDEVRFSAESFSPYAVVTVENVTDENMAAVIGDIVSSVTTNVTTGSSLKFGDTITTTYKFNDNLRLNWPDGDETFPYVETGKTYLLSDKLNLTGFEIPDANKSVKFSEGTYKNQEFGILHAVENTDGTYKITFEVTFGEGLAYELTNLSAQLVIKLSNTVTEENITITLPDGSAYNFEVANNITLPPEVKTAGNQDESDKDVVHWVSTISNNMLNARIYEDGYIFKGTLSDKQSYKAATGKITIDQENGDQLVITPDESWYDADSKTFTYSFTKEQLADVPNGGQIKVYYDGDIDYLGSLNTEANRKTPTKVSVDLANSVVVKEPSDSKVGEDTAEVTALRTFEKMWISKTIDDSSTSRDGENTIWNVVINTNGMTLNDLVIYDSFKGNFKLALKGEPVVTGSGISDGDYTVDKTANPDATPAYSFRVIFNKPVNGEVKLTYETSMEDYDKFLRTNNKTGPGNDAWITYSYVAGGKSYDARTPVVSKTGICVKNAAIDITSATAYVENQQFKWHGVVNQNLQPITGATVKDKLPDNQQVIIKDGKPWVDGFGDNPQPDTITYDEATRTIIMTFGDKLKNAKTEFDIHTRIREENKYIQSWSLNRKPNFQQQLEIETVQEASVKSDPAIVPYDSHVLAADKPSYDYQTHIATFTATVNQNKMAMSDIRVSTDINAYELLDGIKVNDVALTEGTDGYEYNTTTGELIIHLPEVTEEQVGTAAALRTISFNAKVKDDNYLTVNSSKTNAVVLPVTFQLRTADMDKPATKLCQEETATVSFKNEILMKGYEFDGSKNTATYNVVINGPQNQLSQNLEIKDTLGKSMALDIGSVALYTSEINPVTGDVDKLSKLVPVSKGDYSVEVDALDSGKTDLKVRMPRNAGRGIFVLRYQAVAMDNKDMTNCITMYDLVDTTITTFTNEANVKSELFNTGAATAACRLKVTTETSEEPSEKFVSVDVKKENGDLVTTLKVPVNGKTTSIGKIPTTGETYKVQISEDSLPKGFKMPESVTIAPKDGIPATLNNEVTFTLEKKTIDLGVKIVDEDTGEEIAVPLTVRQKPVLLMATPAPTTYKYGYSYEVTEGVPPYGYEGGRKAVLSIDDEGNVTVTGDGTLVGTTILLKDKFLEKRGLVIRKVAEGTGKAVKGAHLELSHVVSDTVVKDCYTNGNDIELDLPKGSYKLTELAAPKGFKTADAIEFEVDEEGYAIIGGIKTKTINMVDAYKQEETLPAVQVIGGGGSAPDPLDPAEPEVPKEFTGKKIAVFECTGEDFDPKAKEPVKVFYEDENLDPSGFTDLNYQKDYIIIDMKYVDSFQRTNPKIFWFEEIPELDEDGTPTGEVSTSLFVKELGKDEIQSFDLGETDPATKAEIVKDMMENILPDEIKKSKSKKNQEIPEELIGPGYAEEHGEGLDPEKEAVNDEPSAEKEGEVTAKAETPDTNDVMSAIVNRDKGESMGTLPKTGGENLDLLFGLMGVLLIFWGMQLAGLRRESSNRR